MTMRMATAIWLVLSAIGAAIVALPDSGDRLFSISAAHGPSAQDMLGIVLLVGGWLVFLVALIGRRHRVVEHLDERAGAGAAFAVGLGVGLIVASVASDVSYWWIAGAVLLFAVQLVLARAAG